MEADPGYRGEGKKNRARSILSPASGRSGTGARKAVDGQVEGMQERESDDSEHEGHG